MRLQKLNIIRFSPKRKDNLFDIVGVKSDPYFEMEVLSPSANLERSVKAVIMLFLCFVPNILVGTAIWPDGGLAFFGMCLPISFGMIGNRISVMPNAKYENYSELVYYKLLTMFLNFKVRAKQVLVRLKGHKPFYYCFIMACQVFLPACPGVTEMLDF